MSKRKQMIGKIVIAVLVVLVIFTFLSNSIHAIMMPTVKIISVKSGTISDLIEAKGEVSYRDIVPQQAFGAWTVKKVLVNEGDSIIKGSPILDIDTSSFEIKRLQMRADLQELENQYNASNLTVETKNVLKMKIDVCELEYKQLLAQYPKDGIVKADQSGIIQDLKVESGNNLAVYQEICKIVVTQTANNQNPYIVRWKVSGKASGKYLNGKNKKENIRLSFVDGSDQKKEADLEINQKRQLSDGEWELTADWPYAEKPELSDEVKIIMTASVVNYKEMLPLSCIQSDGTKKFIYTVEKRNGLFSEEYYLERVNVEVLAKNELEAAVKANEIEGALQGKEIVNYASKDIQAGSVVNVEKIA